MGTFLAIYLMTGTVPVLMLAAVRYWNRRHD